MRGMLRSWSLVQQRAFFESDLHQPLALEADTGKLFPVSNRARDVRDALVEHARQARRVRPVRFEDDRIGSDVGGMARANGSRARRGGPRRARDRRRLGADDRERWRRSASRRVTRSSCQRVYPALTPLVTEPPVHSALSGVSLPVRLRARRGRQVTETPGRVSVHASRIQWSISPRHLSCRGAAS